MYYNAVPSDSLEVLAISALVCSAVNVSILRENRTPPARYYEALS
jgi:hypothetical protein